MVKPILLLKDGLNLLRQVIWILRQAIRLRINGSFGNGDGGLARTYAKVELKCLWSSLFGAKLDPTENVAGYKIKALTYASLRSLLHEIFLDQDYYFLTDKESPLIIDCGSNIGASILYFKKLYPNARIIGFEPFPQAFQALRSNIEMNGLQNVTVFNLALSDKNGEQTLFYESASPLRMSFQRAQGGSISVGTTMLSKYIDQPVDLLKMDIEGAELHVIEELNETKRLPLIDQMIVEYHHHINKETDCLSRMLHILEDNKFGYQLRGTFVRPSPKGQFQDILIYAYRKNNL